MKENITAASNVIPFRKAKLLLVDHRGQPFVPMKPVVDGMGLDWKSQYAKLQGGRFSATMVMITTVAGDRKLREMACLPLRKLAGWLMSIHPNKVRPELREGIIAYQNECDDVLWSYWNNGMAVRTHDRNAVTVIAELVGVTELTALKGVIRDKAKVVPLEKRRSFQQTMHNRLHTRFNVPRIELIPAKQFESACNFIAAYALEGEWLPVASHAVLLDEYEQKNLRALCVHADHMFKHWKTGLGSALRDARSDYYGLLNDHFVAAGVLGQNLIEKVRGKNLIG